MPELLNIVDKNDQIIGQDSRVNIHQKGLLHREIWVWLYNDKKEIVFQLRSKNAETRPNLLDATVGGHVDLNNSYEGAAIKEMKEEISLSVKSDDLIFIAKRRTKYHHQDTGKINNKFKKVFAYKFNGNEEDLILDPAETQRFEWWPIDQILNMKDNNLKKRFIPTIFKDYQDIFHKIKELI